MEWQPIETAPKNNWQFINLYIPPREGHMDDEEYCVGTWLDSEDSFCAYYRCCEYTPIRKPTHWMPLPPAPTTNQGSNHVN